MILRRIGRRVVKDQRKLWSIRKHIWEYGCLIPVLCSTIFQYSRRLALDKEFPWRYTSPMKCMKIMQMYKTKLIMITPYYSEKFLEVTDSFAELLNSLSYFQKTLSITITKHSKIIYRTTEMIRLFGNSSLLIKRFVIPKCRKIWTIIEDNKDTLTKGDAMKLNAILRIIEIGKNITQNFDFLKTSLVFVFSLLSNIFCISTFDLLDE